MKVWFMNLEARERMFLVTGAVALLAFLLYLGMWRPLATSVVELKTSVGVQRATVQWMLRSAGEVRARQAGGNSTRPGLAGRSLLAVVDQSARGVGLGSVLKRVEPEGSDAVRVWLEKAPFDKLITWIAGLSEKRGVAVRAITVERQNENGWVNSRVTLIEPPPQRSNR